MLDYWLPMSFAQTSVIRVLYAFWDKHQDELIFLSNSFNIQIFKINGLNRDISIDFQVSMSGIKVFICRLENMDAKARLAAIDGQSSSMLKKFGKNKQIAPQTQGAYRNS